MTRYVPLSELSDREKERTIQVLSGLLKEQGKLLTELAASNPYVRRRVDELNEERAERLAFLDRVYIREEESKLEERRAERNAAKWEAFA